MKRLIIWVVLIFVMAAVSVASFASKPVKADTEVLVSGNNSFAYDLYKTLAGEKGNLFVSPYSISTALAMTYAGAQGETAVQMAKALRFDPDQAKLHPAMADLMMLLNAGGKGYQLSVANALWGQKGYKFSPEFLGVTNKYYSGGFREVDYIDSANREKARQMINKWVEDKTNNKIKDLIKPKILDELTRLVLTNAIYFKGKWETQFKPANTKEQPFYISTKETVKVPLMYQVGTFNYMEDDKLQVLEMPYIGKDLSMIILLPKKNNTLSGLEKTLTTENVRAWLSRLSQKKVDVFLPRFKMEKEFVLNDKLKALGMKDAFMAGRADFSGMTNEERLYITSVIHKSFVEVNEEGTEAAAATAVVMGTKSAVIDEPRYFRADHPFFFLIRDNRTGSILFMGRLAEPK